MSTNNPTEQDRDWVSRRRFLGYSAASAIAFMAAVLGLLGIGAVLSPALKDKKEGEWVKLGAVSRFTERRPQLVNFILKIKDGWLETSVAKSVWVAVGPQGGFTVFNSRCTHLGCIVDWKDAESGWAFYSPCHAGVFAIDGRVLAGPPPRPLDTLQSMTEGGDLWCRYSDFVVGIPERKPA